VTSPSFYVGVSSKHSRLNNHSVSPGFVLVFPASAPYNQLLGQQELTVWKLRFENCKKEVQQLEETLENEPWYKKLGTKKKGFFGGVYFGAGLLSASWGSFWK
jgi:hypothetical protein